MSAENIFPTEAFIEQKRKLRDVFFERVYTLDDVEHLRTSFHFAAAKTAKVQGDVIRVNVAIARAFREGNNKFSARIDYYQMHRDWKNGGSFVTGLHDEGLETHDIEGLDQDAVLEELAAMEKIMKVQFPEKLNFSMENLLGSQNVLHYRVAKYLRDSGEPASADDVVRVQSRLEYKML